MMGGVEASLTGWLLGPAELKRSRFGRYELHGAERLDRPGGGVLMPAGQAWYGHSRERCSYCKQPGSWLYDFRGDDGQRCPAADVRLPPPDRWWR